MPEGGMPPIAPKQPFFTKRRTIVIAAVGVGLIAAFVGYVVFRPKDGPAERNRTANRANGEAVQLVRRAIDGVFDLPGNERAYPIGIMVENLASIRPQAALTKANLVYEALVEGGITRFLAVFTIADPIENIGPVRSARPYYLDWVKELDALYAHVGGSPQAMSEIQSKKIFDLDQFYNAPYYRRLNLPRAREHNLFTSTTLLAYALRDKAAPSLSEFEAWEFKDDAPLAERPATINPITINFSSASYQVVYRYDQASNTYRRFQADDPHIDMDTNAQISPKNVLIQYVKTGLADAQRLTMETVGSGNALLFRDGQTIEGRWEKRSADDRTEFTDRTGESFVFTAGQTWIEVVPTDREVIH